MSHPEIATEIQKLMIDDNNLETIVVFENNRDFQTCFDSLSKSLGNWTVLTREMNEMTLKKGNK